MFTTGRAGGQLWLWPSACQCPSSAVGPVSSWPHAQETAVYCFSRLLFLHLFWEIFHLGSRCYFHIQGTTFSAAEQFIMKMPFHEQRTKKKKKMEILYGCKQNFLFMLGPWLKNLCPRHSDWASCLLCPSGDPQSHFPFLFIQTVSCAPNSFSVLLN